MRTLAALVLAPLLAVSLAACAGQQASSVNDFKGEQRAVAQSLEDLESAATDEDYTEICTRLLSQQLATVVGKGNRNRCAERMKTLVDDSDSKAVDVKRVTITGTSAKAEVEQKDDNKDERVTVVLVKQGNGWRLNDLRAVRVSGR